MPLDRRHFLAAAALPLIAARPRKLFDPDTLFLTYAGDPTTSVRVQWLGKPGEVADPTVHVAPLDGIDWRSVRTTAKPFPQTDLSVFRADISGLTPGREYQFQIGDASPAYRFRTLPAKATDEFTFVTGGDAGVGPAAVRNNILAAKQDPYFCLVAGDLGYDNGRSAPTAIRFLKNYSDHLIDSKGRLVPLVACLGNHEVDGGYNQPREKATFFFPLFDGLMPERSFGVLDVGDYLSLVLTDTGHVSPIGGEQADWLDKALQARQDRPHLFVADHVPCYPSYRPVQFNGPVATAGTGEEGRKYWVPLFEKYRVDGVLEHHDHTFKKTFRLKGGLKDANGVLYLGDGSWGMLREPKSPEDRPYLETVSKDYHVTVHRLEGERRFHLAMNDKGKLIDVATSSQKPERRRG